MELIFILKIFISACFLCCVVQESKSEEVNRLADRRGRRGAAVLATDFDLGPPRKICCGCGGSIDDDYTDWLLGGKPYQDPDFDYRSIEGRRWKSRVNRKSATRDEL